MSYILFRGIKFGRPDLGAFTAHSRGIPIASEHATYAFPRLLYRPERSLRYNRRDGGRVRFERHPVIDGCTSFMMPLFAINCK